MTRVQRAASATEKKKRAGAAERSSRSQLVHDVENTWCALSSAMAFFQSLSAEARGLTLSDLHAVDVLAREGTICAGELADECGLTRGAITGMLNRLERAGVARRTRDEGDARRLNVSAVADPSGCDCRLPAAFRRLINSFSDTELRAIQRFLDESAATLRTEASALRESKPKG